MSDIDLDVIDGLGTDGFVQESRRTFPHAIRASSVSQMVIAIIDRLGPNQLRRLRIIGHGAPGLQGVADSHNTWEPNRLIRVIGRELQNPTILSMLAASFGPRGFAELHGCEVARGYPGKLLLADLSALWRVPVRGGVNDQTNRPGFEGRYHTAAPAPGGGTIYR